MNRGTNSNTALFLMELIAVIGFFSLVSVICVRLFVAASATSTDSVNMNEATRVTESVTESWMMADGKLPELQALFPEAVLELSGNQPESGTLTLYYDKEWQAVAAGDPGAAFAVTLKGQSVPAAEVYSKDADGSAVKADITAAELSDGSVICTLTPDHYIGEEAEE